MLRIISMKDGFRRCGVAHSTTPTDWPDDHFTDDEKQVLMNERMLKVGHIEGEPDDGDGPGRTDPPGPQDIARIGAAIRTLGVEDYDQSGKPNLKKIRAAMGEDVFDFDARVRDQVWDQLTQDGFRTPEKAGGDV